jgi:hypothetical protein
MPNWCENVLTVTGDEEALERFCSAAQDREVLSLQALVPVVALSPLHPNAWRTASWGTKWDVLDPEVEASEGVAMYSFHSAWAPPLEAVRVVASRYPALRFELCWCEGGEDIAGMVRFTAGRLVESRRGTFTELCAMEPDEDGHHIEWVLSEPLEVEVSRLPDDGELALRERIASGELSLSSVRELPDCVLVSEVLQARGITPAQVWDVVVSQLACLDHPVVTSRTFAEGLVRLGGELGRVGQALAILGPALDAELARDLRSRLTALELTGCADRWVRSLAVLGAEWSSGDLTDLLAAVTELARPSRTCAPRSAA